ncbi:hypothetical protein [Amycolatopsis sp. MEPSY49]|uniref:hypothetical protein n=1 Tax=Amycolatopsis sp. MEPSY49 TaxID=3151600 RepID=UPI003EF60016
MKTARTLLVLPGLAALAWGVVLFVEYAFPLRPDVFGTVGWIVGGPLVNDGVVAPLTAVLGIVLARVVPRPWRVPVVTGTVITGVLLIVAFPLLWRPYGTPPMPGLHDGNPALGLTLTLAAVWLLVVLAPLVRRGRRAAPADVRDATPDTRTAGPGPQGTPADRPGIGSGALGTPAEPPGTPVDPPGSRPAPRGTPAEPLGTPRTPAEPPGSGAIPPGPSAEPPGPSPTPPRASADPPGSGA